MQWGAQFHQAAPHDRAVRAASTAFDAIERRDDFAFSDASKALLKCRRSISSDV